MNKRLLSIFSILFLAISLTTLVQAEVNEEDLCKSEILKRNNLVKEEFRINCDDKFPILDKRYRTKNGESFLRSIKHYEIVTRENRRRETIEKRVVTKNELFRLRDGNTEKVFLKEYDIVNNRSIKKKVVDHFRGRAERIRTWNTTTREQLLGINLDKRTGKIQSIKRFGNEGTFTIYSDTGDIKAYTDGDYNIIEKHDHMDPSYPFNPAIKNGYTSWWRLYNDTVRENEYDMIFIGDSITFGFSRAGANVWNEYYGSRNAYNIGFPGDTTNGILQRLTYGNLETTSPKVFVIKAGTNNVPRVNVGNGEFKGEATSEEIFEGVAANVAKLRGVHPTSKVIVLGILPRGNGIDNEFRQRIRGANTLIEGLADSQNVYYHYFGDKLLNPDGSLNASLFDIWKLHITEDGYRHWAVEIESTVKKIYKE